MKKSDLVLSVPATWDSWPICQIMLFLRTVRLLPWPNPRPQLAGKVAARYGIKEVYANHLELLEN